MPICPECAERNRLACEPLGVGVPDITEDHRDVFRCSRKPGVGLSSGAAQLLQNLASLGFSRPQLEEAVRRYELKGNAVAAEPTRSRLVAVRETHGPRP